VTPLPESRWIGTTSADLIEFDVHETGIELATTGHMSDGSCRLAPARSFLVEDAAILLGVSRRTVYYRIREGKLRTIRTRCGSQRVLLESIEGLLREDQGKRARRAAMFALAP